MDSFSDKSKKSKRPVVEEEVTKKKKVKTSLATINFTGIREDEIIVGVNPTGTAGIEMQVKGVTYYPIDLATEEMLRDQFKSIEFFSTMSLQERKDWSVANVKKYQAPGKENHLFDPQNAGLKVKFLKIEFTGKKTKEKKHFVEKLDAAVIESLLKGNEEDEEGYWPITQIYDLLKPENKSSKANRHTLLLSPYNWEIKRLAPKKSIFNGPIVLRLTENSVTTTYNTIKSNLALGDMKESERLVSFKAVNHQEIGVIYDSGSQRAKAEIATRESLFKLLGTEKLLTTEEYAQCEDIAKLIAPFTPSLYKSLMQKIIRTQCTFVVHDEREYGARPFLLVTFILLALHPGSFNPNKNRFVSGLESATKRLAIIVLEDAYIKDISQVTLLLIDAYIKQEERTWMPPVSQFLTLFQIALEAYESPTYLLYLTNKEYTISNLTALDKKSLAPYKLNALLIKQIGSMAGDINFFSHLAQGPRLAPESKVVGIIKMPLIHCIDQHCFTSIGHFIPYNTEVAAVDRGTEGPYKALFGRIWNELSSVNGRRDRARILTMENEPFVKEVRLAQRNIFKQKFTVNTSIVGIEEDEDPHKFTYTIDSSWLAGLIGVIEVSLVTASKAKPIVVLRTDNVEEMVVIRNPRSSRSSQANDKAIPDLTTEEKEEAIELAKVKLRAGYPLKHVPNVLPVFKGAKVWLDDSGDITTYTIQYADGSRKEWEGEATKITYYFPICKDEEEEDEDDDMEEERDWISRALRMRGASCVARDCDERFLSVISNYSLLVLKRLYMYLANYRPTIKLYDIARDGSASKLDVALEDSAVFTILCAICTLYPVALELGPTNFVVKNGPVIWHLRAMIKSYMNEELEMIVDDENNWAPIRGDPTTPLFTHQQEAVDEMLAKVKKGKRGNELFLSVGLGKTMIAMAFIKALVEKGTMCQYCIYTTPPSGVVNAISEFERYGMPYTVVTTKIGKDTYKDKEFEPYKINIVLHDQMRRPGVYRQLKRHAANMLFIVDEFHEASDSKTQRSSIALEIAKLSKDFISMTGTIVRNTDCGDLIMWLEQIVDFYIDSENYLVAFGALISRKYNTGNILISESILAPFTEAEESRYYSRVTSKLGGTSSKFDFGAALNVCYEACDREMVKQVLLHVVEKKEIVFLLAKSIAHQKRLRDTIVCSSKGVIKEEDVFLVDRNRSIILKPETKTNIKVVITTLTHVTGFTLTKAVTAITTVYPSNNSTREQFVGRLDRIGRVIKEFTVIQIHAGILTYLLTKYAGVGSFAKSLKEFADEAGEDYDTLMKEIK